MSEARAIAASLRLARGCARDARLLFAEGSRNAAYLAEQALEQVIRAIATFEGLHIERHDAHQLDKTVQRFPAENPVSGEIAALVWLEAYATSFRYPTGTGRIPHAPDAASLAGAIGDIEGLLQRLARHFRVDLEAADGPAGTSAPVRR